MKLELDINVDVTLAIESGDETSNTTLYVWDKTGKTFDRDLVFFIQTNRDNEIIFMNTAFFGSVGVFIDQITKCDFINRELVNELLDS